MGMTSKHILAIVVLAIIAAASLLFSRPAAAPEVRFAMLDGRAFATSDLRGKVVLVNFWATSCAICVKEMPMLVETQRKFAPRGYETVAVAMSYDHPNLVAGYARKNALPFHFALDLSGEIAKAFGGVSVTPTSIVFDRGGRIVKRYLGAPDEAELHALLEKALAAPA